jgi:hypothetical protein
VISALRRVANTARALPAIQLVGVSRGEDTVVRVPREAPFISLAADIPPTAGFNRYAIVLTRNGGEISEAESPAPADGQPITMLIPRRQLAPGNHELALYGIGPAGKRSDKISRYPFVVQFN